MPIKLIPEIITAAILGFEEQKRHVDTQIAELRAVLTGGPTEPAARPEPPKRKRRKMSAAGRKAIAEAQRKRWAASKKAAESPKTPKAPKAKRRLSKAGRAAIVAATKKRWALKRAEAAKGAGKKAPAKVTVRKGAVRKSSPAKVTKARVKKAARKPAPAKPRPTAAAGPPPTPEVVAQ